ncbi:protoporphyrinogen oxidase [Pseudarthrobacter phenanthrenivorans]|uniref:Protoporphyrinogen oxidase n=1 Tax=Pseudarthrobacter phenanthrenivorans TaxID=361575 RepID=A0A3B0FYF1_PSEPS|nr:flavodoxin domain-containing protein [Pseudarthrobacter phenanthrenivorans]RKO24875.1 protoporphyrinogen oxidase [Pseudarthrobacter phenanthrenivorans]TPV51487.1 protoporphyrinogen oxidase [Pseudarthrobacter phenanthrenivorans]
MAKIYIAYGSVEGQTAHIADYIADVIRAHGHEAETADLKHSPGSIPDGQDGVIVAASIHVGKHEGYVADFVRHNREDLERLPSALVSVSLSAHSDEAGAESYVGKFEEETGWHPRHVAMFGGALLYTQYNFLKRQLMKKIVKGQGSQDLDTSRDYIYTEWDGVKHFTEEFLAAVTVPAGRNQPNLATTTDPSGSSPGSGA